MKSVALEAFPRSVKKRNAVKKLRADGRIPGVLYGGGLESLDVEIDVKTFGDLVKNATSEALLVDLDCDGKKNLALVQEVQHHPLSGDFLHVDLHTVKEDAPATVYVPVESTGEAIGVKVDGGLLEHILFRVRVRGLLKDIPDMLVADVSTMEIGHTLHIKDLEVPDGVEIMANADS
ncbi:uncharacterized protein METZ01_LOCUS242543, partial [marine metagenome]